MNKSGPSIDPWSAPVSMFSHLLKTFSTFICCLVAITELLMINHKYTTLQLVGHDLDSRKLLGDLLKELQMFHCYRLQTSIFQALTIDNVGTIILSKSTMKF